jgi:protein-disulfide isomerase
LVRENSNQKVGTNSKVTIVEFGDFQCPACGAVHPLVKQVVDSNKDNVTFVFRNYPLSQHANAEIAAEAAEAAGAQGKYWEMYDKLFDKQADWSESKKPLEMFVSYAKDLGLDVTKFKQEVEDKKYSAKITGDQADGNVLGVNATPTFYIDGVKFTGDYSSFKSQIEAKIK